MQEIIQLQDALNQNLVAVNSQPFANSILSQYMTRGSLSQKQLAAVQNMLQRIYNPPQAVQAVSQDEIAKIHAFFATASKNAKSNPKLRLMWQGVEYRLQLATASSKYPGSIVVKRKNIDDYATPFVYVGSISVTGQVYSRNHEAELTGMIQKFVQNPVEVAREFGRLTNSCCFCDRTLTAELSVTTGVGPICAERWGINRWQVQAG